MAHRHAQTMITAPSAHRFEPLTLSGGKRLEVRAGQVATSKKGIAHVNQDPITAASFGSSVDFAIPPSYMLRSVVANLNLSNIAATFVGGTAPAITWKANISLYDFIQRIEFYSHGGANLIQVLQNEALDVQRELFMTPAQDAVFEATARSDGSAAAQVLYAHLGCFIDQTGGYPAFATMGDLRIRVFFKSLTNGEHYTVTGSPSSFTITGGTGVISSARLKLAVEEGISHGDKKALIAAHDASPKLYRLCLPRTQVFSLAASATGLSSLLNSITGPVAFIVLHLIDNVTGGEVALTTFELKDPTGDSLVGNLALDPKLNRYQMSAWFPSDAVATTNRAVISFAESPMAAVAHGRNTGFHTMTGSEVIEIAVPALSNASTLYVQFYQYAWLEIGSGSVQVHV